MNRLVIYLSLSVALVAGMYFGMQIANNGLWPDSFWEIKYIQVLDILISVTIAVFVVSEISKQFNYGLKQRELVAGCIDEYEKALSSAYDCFSRYAREPIKGNAQEVLRLLKAASNHLSIMIEVISSVQCSVPEHMRDKFETCFMSLKIAMTDSPFGSDKGAVKDAARLDKIDAAYCNARKGMFKAKLCLYK